KVGLKKEYVRGEFTVENCREVAEDCEVTYVVERAEDNTTETVRAETSGCSEGGSPEPKPEEPKEPEAKTKTVCDTVYTLEMVKVGLKKEYVRGEFTVENCREVAEDCEVTYEVVRAEDNTTETEKAVAICKE
ncbi:MAG: hypothetical protein J1F29_03410, partial [Lentimicrobiaceae bacterium]|nr:hypothetical protein [Lentimicrobiaceae bacterium]